MPAVRAGTFALVVVLCALAGRAPAQDALPDLPEPAAPDPLTDLMRRVTDLEGEAKRARATAADAAKKPTVNWMMQIQADALWSDADANTRRAVGAVPDGTAFRRARFGMYGDYGPFEYRIAMDFALQGRPSFIDVFVALNDVPGLGRVRVGHFFEPFGLEQYSQNRFVTFLERALPTEPIAPGRNFGVMANGSFADQRGTWGVGLFHTDSDAFGDDGGTDFRAAITGRATLLPWYEETDAGADLLHIGTAYSARATKADQVRFAVRPEVRIGATAPNVPNFVDTGTIAASFFQLVGTELLLIRGPFSAQAEYVFVPVDANRGGALYFHSWYAMGSVLLTGESRQYRKTTGTLERIVPKRDFLKREGGTLALGPGAWELAARVSHLELNSGGVRGGRLTDVTIGANWYLNPYLRVTANYVRAFLTPRTGPRGGTDFYGVRIGYEF